MNDTAWTNERLLPMHIHRAWWGQLVSAGAFASILLLSCAARAQDVIRLPPDRPGTAVAASPPNHFQQLVEEQTRYHEDLQQVHAVAEEPSISDLTARIQALEQAREKELAAAKKEAEDAAKSPEVEIAGRIHVDHWAFPETSPGANAFETGNPADSVDRKSVV